MKEMVDIHRRPGSIMEEISMFPHTIDNQKASRKPPTRGLTYITNNTSQSSYIELLKDYSRED